MHKTEQLLHKDFERLCIHPACSGQRLWIHPGGSREWIHPGCFRDCRFIQAVPETGFIQFVSETVDSYRLFPETVD